MMLQKPKLALLWLIDLVMLGQTSKGSTKPYKASPSLFANL